MKSALGIFVTALLISTNGFAQYNLEYKVGTSPLHYKAHTSLQTVQSMMGQSATVSFTSDQLISMTNRKEGSELVYSITIDSSENMAVMPSGDTNRTPSPAVGKVKETRVYKNGEEISSQWLDTAFAQTQAGQMKDFGSIFFKLPSGSVDTGATWSQEKIDTVATAGGQGDVVVNTNTNYRFVGSQSYENIKCAKIVFTGQVGLKGTATIQGTDLDIDGKGDISGSALFDIEGGRIVSMSGVSSQDVNMSSTGANPMTIPMNQKTDYEIQLVK